MPPIVQLLQMPVVLYTITLTIVWTLIQAIARIGSKEFSLNISNYSIFVAFMSL
jgi:hypothetical protein